MDLWASDDSDLSDRSTNILMVLLYLIYKKKETLILITAAKLVKFHCKLCV